MTLSASSRPRLRRTIALAPTLPGELYVHGPTGSSRLVGPGADALRTVLPLLDGQRTLAEIVQQSGASSAALERMLRALEAAGIVEDALGAEPPESPTEAFLGQLTPSPRVALQRLTHAKLSVIGTGPVGAAVAEHLLTLGSRSLLLSGPQADALAPRLAHMWPEAQVQADPAHTLEDEAAERILAARPAFVVVALEGERATLLRAINARALEHRVPWTPAVLRDRQAECGPTVLPHESACWRCYDLRRKGANPWLDRHLAYEALREAGLVPGEAEWGHLPTAAGILGALAAQEAAAVVTGAWPPALRNHVAVVDVLQATSRRHRVLKLPRCPACGASGIPDLDAFDLEAGRT